MHEFVEYHYLAYREMGHVMPERFGSVAEAGDDVSAVTDRNA